MRGAIVGDIIGSAFINSPQSNIDFQLLKPFSAYTDDTVLTIATADAILRHISFEQALREWTQKYPKAGYQAEFLEWALSNHTKPYKSCGDGAARRISPIGFAAISLEQAIAEAEKATAITHPSIDKIKASQALCGSIFLAKTGRDKTSIKDFLINTIGYDLPETLSKECATMMEQHYCSPVPCAIAAFLDAENFEEAIRKAIWLEGPSNTIASITGAISQAYYKHIPKAITRKSLSRLDNELEKVLIHFEDSYCKELFSPLEEVVSNY
ncbi:ADP-ribosylglycohydrolase family protein [Carboxylicivirga sediminis]|uniref:ADP-ribosylglycohydrolase family protein n=1 Tax=Carboxylicivirga sediminis TaxID=2006564 RepID=A0A941F1M2_9BACT|nr:ADP-ribosylglycohydrolase family protein [Carboxylicivirga sediminis]MBR8534712.1 ADP-ribosylglycohydrolase family protein [Carboxylicivirga sediminis]